MLWAVGAASFLFIALKAMQQLNVFYGRYWAVLPVSFGLAATEVFVISQIVLQGPEVVVPLASR